jgi:hypothetical protein
MELPKGELDNVSVSELGGKGFNFAIGAGGGGGGVYGNRMGGNKRKSVNWWLWSKSKWVLKVL